jgi:hypothetical protein
MHDANLQQTAARGRFFIVLIELINESTNSFFNENADRAAFH